MNKIEKLAGAPFLNYQDNKLFLENVELDNLAKKYQTPLFVYSKSSILDAINSYKTGIGDRNAKVHYAVKANSSIAILKIIKEAGCGFDTVSKGEIARAIQAGANANDIVFSGVGKTFDEMIYALNLGIACFNIESLPELELLNKAALSINEKAPISLRINPHVDAKTHPYISTGLKDNKFGIDHTKAVDVYEYAAGLQGIEIVGIDCHIGSQIMEIEPYLEAFSCVLDLADKLKAKNINLEHIDIGGGLGILYENQTPPLAKDLLSPIWKMLDSRGYGDKKILLEPGRSIIGNAGVCLSSVLYLKDGHDKNFCIIDAAMNDLPRPALYEAYHQIVQIQKDNQTPLKTYDIVGPVCESGDWLGLERNLNAKQGDILAVLSAGAYCMSMASNYNTRAKPAEVIVDGDSYKLIRKRDELKDMFLGEIY